MQLRPIFILYQDSVINDAYFSGHSRLASPARYLPRAVGHRSPLLQVIA